MDLESGGSKTDPENSRWKKHNHEIEFDSTFFPNSVSKKEEEVKKLKEKVSDIVHQEDKTKQAKLKLVHFI